MTDDTLDIVDKLAMTVGGGLILLAIPVIGFLTTITGSMSPLYEYQVTNKAGETVVKTGLAKNIPDGATILTEPLVDPMTRAWIVFVGLLVLAGYAVYRVLAPKTSASESGTERRSTAD
jgi:hypothetical protein